MIGKKKKKDSNGTILFPQRTVRKYNKRGRPRRGQGKRMIMSWPLKHCPQSQLMRFFKEETSNPLGMNEDDGEEEEY